MTIEKREEYCTEQRCVQRQGGGSNIADETGSKKEIIATKTNPTIGDNQRKLTNTAWKTSHIYMPNPDSIKKRIEKRRKERADTHQRHDERKPVCPQRGGTGGMIRQKEKKG